MNRMSSNKSLSFYKGIIASACHRRGGGNFKGGRVFVEPPARAPMKASLKRRALIYDLVVEFDWPEIILTFR